MAHRRNTYSAVVSNVDVGSFPTILEDDFKVHWLSLTYFLDLVRVGTKLSSIKTYADHLVDFISQLETDELELDQVSDNWLVAYKDTIKSRLNSSGNVNTEDYATQILRSTVYFLNWLEVNKYIRGVVGEDESYKVRIQKTSNDIKHRLSKSNSKGRRRYAAPRTEWIDAIKIYGPKRVDLAVRFELMIDWAKVIGLRAMEDCNLKIEQLPQIETSEKAILNKKLLTINLNVTKGGKIETVPVSPMLVKQTWEYINGYRNDIVEIMERNLRKKYEIYRDPGYIFLSNKTGSMLTPRSFSNSIRKAYLAAVENGDLTIDERVWAHGLRHNFVVNTMKQFDMDKRIKRPEAVARQATRHGSVDAMEPYLTDRFNDDFHG